MKKLAGRPQKVKTDVVGLDVHKDMIAYCHLDAEGNEVSSGKLKATVEHVLGMLRQATQLRPVHVTMEASGGIWYLYDALVEVLGVDFVHVAHPKRLRAIANSSEKNDANDAYWLAFYTYEGILPQSWIPTPAYREIRIATRARRESVLQQTRATVLLKSFLRQMGQRPPGQRLDSQASMAWLKELTAATPGAVGVALKVLIRRLEAARADVALWEEEIERMAMDLPEVELLRKRLPGVGPILSATIVAETGPLTRFTCGRALGKYTGLVPSDHSTGGRTRHGGMTREGSAHLRWALGQAVMCCLRHSRALGSGPESAVARWVDRKSRRVPRGKARVAAARKLATAIWWLAHNPDTFNPFKAFA